MKNVHRTVGTLLYDPATDDIGVVVSTLTPTLGEMLMPTLSEILWHSGTVTNGPLDLMHWEVVPRDAETDEDETFAIPSWLTSVVETYDTGLALDDNRWLTIYHATDPTSGRSATYVEGTSDGFQSASTWRYDGLLSPELVRAACIGTSWFAGEDGPEVPTTVVDAYWAIHSQNH
jgi:hypothetical protein